MSESALDFHHYILFRQVAGQPPQLYASDRYKTNLIDIVRNNPDFTEKDGEFYPLWWIAEYIPTATVDGSLPSSHTATAHETTPPNCTTTKTSTDENR